MAITRARTSSVAQGPSTRKTVLGGNDVILGGSYDAIGTTNGTGSSGIITFSSIPSTYKHLQLRCIIRNTSTDSGEQTVLITANSDTGSNYATHRLTGNGSAAGAQSYTSGTAIAPYFNANGGMAANIYGAYVLDILDYANTNKNKTLRLLGGVDFNGSGTVGLISGAWFNTNAISTLTLTSGGGSFTTASQFDLYGIK
jgi:hypothetical protein